MSKNEKTTTVEAPPVEKVVEIVPAAVTTPPVVAAVEQVEPNLSARRFLVNRSKVAVDVLVLNPKGEQDSIMVQPMSARGAELAEGWKLDPTFVDTDIQLVTR